MENRFVNNSNQAAVYYQNMEDVPVTQVSENSNTLQNYSDKTEKIANNFFKNEFILLKENLGKHSNTSRNYAVTH